MEPFARKRVATRLGAVPVGEPGAVEVLTAVVSRNVVTSPLSGLHCALLQIELMERIALEQGGSRALGSDGGPYEDLVSLGHVTLGQILVLRDPDGDEISLVVGRLRFDVAARVGGQPLGEVPAELVPLLRLASGRGVVYQREFRLLEGDTVRLRAMVEPSRLVVGGGPGAESRRCYVARDDLGPVVLAAD